MIGCNVEGASATGSCQFKIGVGSNHWICGDSSFNIYDKDGNQITGGGGGGAGSGVSQAKATAIAMIFG